jgi:hypothetical protein
MLRVLRLLSLFKMERQVRAVSVMQQVLLENKSQLLICFYAMLVVVALFGSLMYNIVGFSYVSCLNALERAKGH